MTRYHLGPLDYQTKTPMSPVGLSWEWSRDQMSARESFRDRIGH